MAITVLGAAAADGPAVASQAGQPVGAVPAELPAAFATQTPAASTTTPEKAPREQVAVTGYLLIHSPIFNRALANGGGRRYDFAPMFRYVRRYLRSADLAICHVETPMTSLPPQGYPLFNTPPALARAIASTGWDVCSTLPITRSIRGGSVSTRRSRRWTAPASRTRSHTALPARGGARRSSWSRG